MEERRVWICLFDSYRTWLLSSLP